MTHQSHEGKDMCVCLHQIRTIDYRRLSSLMGQVDEKDFKEVKEAFLKLYT
ncbi:MAG: type II toxin-antitoxin system PemK/MazF family toxin [Candidatus Vogelbacteria bacterium]|nr:type II toxin-antitoxin system PemK/MazF family toxin [Candidatus Vogelbacteria bacterium]